jgi:hypothetical protein
MREFLAYFFDRAWQSLSAVACVFFSEGRQALLVLVRARTALAVLAIEQKRMEIQFQRANNGIDFVQKLGVELSPEQKTKIVNSILCNIEAQGTYDFVDPVMHATALMLTQRRPPAAADP